MIIKFNKHHVTNGSIKVLVHYSAGSRLDGRKAVTIYAKDYDNQLALLFPESHKNDSDSRTDYFEKGKAVLFEDHPLYAVALARVQSFSE